MKRLLFIFAVLLSPNAFGQSAEVLATREKIETLQRQVRDSLDILTREFNNATYILPPDVKLDSLALKRLEDSVRVRGTRLINFQTSSAKRLTARLDSFATITNLSVDSTGILRWTVWINSRSFEGWVEQYKWNQWRPTGATFERWTPIWDTWTLKDSARVSLHSGTNKFRIRIFYPIEIISKEIEYQGRPIDRCGPWKVSDKITFDEKTEYEIYNSGGMIVKSGKAQTVNVSGLSPDVYYLSAGKLLKEFIKVK